MRWIWVGLVAVAACGRFGFDGAGAGSGDDSVDARPPIDGSGVANACGNAMGSYSAAVMADHPVAYWRMADPEADACDEVGTYGGVYSGDCTHGVPGALANNVATQFGGASCKLTIGDVLTFGGQTAFSVELWANITFTNGSVRWLVSHRLPQGQPNQGYSLCYQDSTLWFEHTNADATLSYTSGALPSLDAFHHIVFATSGTHQRLYVDGALVGETMFAVDGPTTDGDLMFGDFIEENPSKVMGTLDEIAFYDYELAPAAIAAHFAAR